MWLSLGFNQASRTFFLLSTFSPWINWNQILEDSALKSFQNVPQRLEMFKNWRTSKIHSKASIPFNQPPRSQTSRKTKISTFPNFHRNPQSNFSPENSLQFDHTSKQSKPKNLSMKLSHEWVVYSRWRCRRAARNARSARCGCHWLADGNKMKFSANSQRRRRHELKCVFFGMIMGKSLSTCLSRVKNFFCAARVSVGKYSRRAHTQNGSWRHVSVGKVFYSPRSQMINGWDMRTGLQLCSYMEDLVLVAFIQWMWKHSIFPFAINLRPTTMNGAARTQKRLEKYRWGTN